MAQTYSMMDSKANAQKIIDDVLKKTKSEYEEMLANKKVPKSSIWKPITEED